MEMVKASGISGKQDSGGMMPGKAPAFQFYVKDWLSDPQLRMASPATRGIWIDCLCFMWSSPVRGSLQISRDNLARMTGASSEEIDRFVQEAVEVPAMYAAGVCLVAAPSMDDEGQNGVDDSSVILPPEL